MAGYCKASQPMLTLCSIYDIVLNIILYVVIFNTLLFKEDKMLSVKTTVSLSEKQREEIHRFCSKVRLSHVLYSGKKARYYIGIEDSNRYLYNADGDALYDINEQSLPLVLAALDLKLMFNYKGRLR